MNEDLLHHRSYLFTVRMWLEDLGDGHTEWRGKAQNISSGEACYFREWATLLAFLQIQTMREKQKGDHEPDGKERSL